MEIPDQAGNNSTKCLPGHCSGGCWTWLSNNRCRNKCGMTLMHDFEKLGLPRGAALSKSNALTRGTAFTFEHFPIGGGAARHGFKRVRHFGRDVDFACNKLVEHFYRNAHPACKFRLVDFKPFNSFENRLSRRRGCMSWHKQWLGVSK